jgi:hypothetical protein
MARHGNKSQMPNNHRKISMGGGIPTRINWISESGAGSADPERPHLKKKHQQSGHAKASKKAVGGSKNRSTRTSAWVAVVELVADLAVALGSGLQVLPREHNHLGRADHETCWPRAARSLRALSSSRALRRRRRRQQRESWERVGIHQGQRGCEGARRRWRGAGSGMEPADGAGWI